MIVMITHNENAHEIADATITMIWRLDKIILKC